jgi:predicted phage tail protein
MGAPEWFSAQHVWRRDEAMSDNDLVVAVYSARAAVEGAVKQLRKSGYDIRKLSIVVKDHHIEERVVGFYNAGDRIKHWGKCGALWGGILGLLFGVALFIIPGIGPGLITNPLAVWTRGALGGAVTIGGLSALAAGVYSMSLPKDSVLKYELTIETDDEFLLVAHSTAGEAAVARDILCAARPAELGVHSSLPLKTGARGSIGPQIA